MPIYIDSLSAIAHIYDAIILDQFGVIHDGFAPYLNAIETLGELESANIPVVIVTNSGSSARSNEERLIKLGFRTEYFSNIITSGEICRKSAKGKKIFLIGQSGKDYEFDKADLVIDSAEADLAIVLGINYPQCSIDAYRSLLKDLKCPMLCGNPDLLNVGPAGLTPGPGQIAKIYEEMGGYVTWIGKPFPLIYEAATHSFFDAKKILCIGDSLEHDVQGGINMGFDTLLVQTGVSENVDIDKTLFKPNYIMPHFNW